MRVLGFGTYDASRQPRPAVLLQGLEHLGDEVQELNVPLGFSTADRVDMLHRPWLLHRLVIRLTVCWATLAWRRRRLRAQPDAVLVGYLAQFDVVLARLLFPRCLLVLDLLVFADDTAKDRGVGSGLRTAALRVLDRVAIGCADLVVVDTDEHLGLLSPRDRMKAVVAPVGAADEWFRPPPSSPSGGPLRIVFFGLFTPLQGAPVIGAALASLPVDLPVEVTMVGTGQDFDLTRGRVGEDPRVRWLPWVPSEELPDLVAVNDVCLGIFGTSAKALRVVPTKVFQGAAAGCAIVTSDTEPQRRALADAAVFVPAGNARYLAETLAHLASRPDEVTRLRRLAHARALQEFAPTEVARPVAAALRDQLRKASA